MGYCLSLADGNHWVLSGNGKNAEFISELAGIMRLKECEQNGFLKLLCLNGKKEKSDDYDSHWKVYESPSIRILYNENSDKSICEIKSAPDETIKYINMWYSLMPIYMRSMSLGGLPFHAGLAELNGKGVLFAAPGNTGKSTCCRRLPDYWKPLCDDEALVVLSKTGEYMAHPLPTWSDYIMKRASNTWDAQHSVPLSAIFFIEQAETDEIIPMARGRSAVRITGSADEVFMKLLRNLYTEEKIEFRKNTFNNAFDMAQKIPSFQLRVSLNGHFWEKIEEVIA